MSVSSEVSRVTYAGSGSTGPFAVPFRFMADADLLVTRRDSDDVETTLTLNNDYTVTGALNAAGTVTLSVALESDEVLVIRRDPALVQSTSIANNGSYFAKTHEDTFDRLLMQLQALKDVLDRSIGISESYDPNGVNLRVKPETGKALVWLSTSLLGNATIGTTDGVTLPGEGRTVATLSAYLLNNAVYNAKDYGLVADGVTDDSLVLQTAIDAARDAGGGLVMIHAPGHTVLVSKQGSVDGLNYCVRLRDNVTVFVTPGTTVKMSGTSAAAVVFLARGTGTLNASFPTTTLGADAAIRATQLQVASSANFTVGNDIFIEDDNGFEVNEVLSIPDGTHVNLKRPTRFAFTTAASCKVSVVGFMTNARLEGGGTIDGGAVSADAVVQFSDCKHGYIGGMRVTNSGGTGRGILFSSRSHRCVAERNTVWSITDRGMETYTQTSHNTFRNNWVRDAAIHGVVLHGINNISVDDTAEACGTTSTSDSNFHMDSARYCRFINPRSFASKGRGLQFDGGTIQHCGVDGGTVEGAADNGIYCANASDISIVGTEVTGSGLSGVKADHVTRFKFDGMSRGNLSNGFYLIGAGADIWIDGDLGGNSARGIRFDVAPTGVLVISPSVNVQGNALGGVLYANGFPVTGTVIGTNGKQIRRGPVLLGRLIGANMNSTSDQQIDMGSANWILTEIVVTDSSGNLTTAVGGIYTAAAKGGTAIVAAGQAYAALTTSVKVLKLTLANNDRRTEEALYLSLSTPQGAAMTADVYVYGYPLD